MTRFFTFQVKITETTNWSIIPQDYSVLLSEILKNVLQKVKP